MKEFDTCDENHNKPTDLSKVYEDFKNSDVVIDQEFWNESNRKINEQLEIFAEQNREMNYGELIYLRKNKLI